tara:strand:- start:26302 stop:26841 length:540 start_codon:yes stop_codon:yes gene_type:complete
MIHALINGWRRFRRNDDGSAMLVEFAVMMPLLFGCFMMAVEMGIYSIRHMFLDRGLDTTVRFIRLNTNTPMTHAQIKDMVCSNAGFLKECDEALRLEMIRVDPRNFASFDQPVDCVDQSQPATAERGLILGKEHELMLLRACFRFKPIFPTTGLGYALEKDGSGKARMVSMAAFVQEPN